MSNAILLSLTHHNEIYFNQQLMLVMELVIYLYGSFTRPRQMVFVGFQHPDDGKIYMIVSLWFPILHELFPN